MRTLAYSVLKLHIAQLGPTMRPSSDFRVLRNFA